MSKRPLVDFYQVLGIASSATLKEIGKAYLLLARKHHPDSSDAQDDSAAEFKTVAEAYETLSDPQRRREYDRRRKRQTFSNQRLGRRRSPQSVQSPGNASTFGHLFEPSAVRKNTIYSCRHAERARVSDTICDLPISPEEARVGARVSFTLAISRLCDHCAGSNCSVCGGVGSVNQRLPLRIQLPPGVLDRTMLRIPSENMLLCVRIRPYW